MCGVHDYNYGDHRAIISVNININFMLGSVHSIVII